MVSLPDSGAGAQIMQTYLGAGDSVLVPCHHALDPHCPQGPISPGHRVVPFCLGLAKFSPG